jgi:hypothetical protein
VATSRDPAKRCLAALRKRGVLLAVDKRLPSLTTIVAGEPVSGSWWKHAAAKPIYDAKVAMAARSDVLVLRLVSGKVTYVDRSLWPDVLAVAMARDDWQMRFLPVRESLLLDLVDQKGVVRIDEDLAALLDGQAGDVGRDLESRLLALGGQVHTKSGAHARTLTSWKRWATKHRVKPTPDVAAARARLEVATRALGQGATLPWWKRPLRKRW